LTSSARSPLRCPKQTTARFDDGDPVWQPDDGTA
jgi:hypothetical protein